MEAKTNADARTLHGRRILIAGLALLAIVGAGPRRAFSQEEKTDPVQQWDKLTPEEKEALRERYRAFKRLQPQQQGLILKNLDQFRSMTPEERRHIFENHREFRSLSPEDRGLLNRNYQRWRDLPQARREQLRKNYQRFLRMSPEERRLFMEKYRVWERMTPEQRSRLRRQPAPGARPPGPAPRKRPNERP